ncbi:unnamed protein product [Phytomonas sp. Hart1]|nr:unnamed protein product [Phytomonas sp. Hart1]|eukprot:CCW71789.1 unnamed protein product [Phytomonas sp. isolate Hart1]
MYSTFSKLSPENHESVAELKDFFMLLDTGGDGFVHVNMLRELFLSTVPKMTEEDFNDLLVECQFDQMEQLAFEQYYVLSAKLKTLSLLSLSATQLNDCVNLEEVFAPFDPSGTGYVSYSIFNALMSGKGDQLCVREATEMKLRLERVGLLKKNRVNYRMFISSISACDILV